MTQSFPMVYTTDPDLFTFLYEINEATSPPTISVTISSGDSPHSPPTSPPAPHGTTPATYVFGRDRMVSFDLESPEGNYLQGTMKIVPFNDPVHGDNAGFFCDINFGPRRYHHFEGINLTFKL